jgi:hypothetical protein
LSAPAWSTEKRDLRDTGGDRGIGAGDIDYSVVVDGTGMSYPWIDATGGTQLTSGDDAIDAVLWPFDFAVYNDLRIGGVDSLDVNSNGSVHTDPGGPRTLWINCGDAPSTIDGQWVAALGDDLNPAVGGSVWYDVSGVAPNRILTVEWVDVPEFSGSGVVDLEISFYEGSNKIVSQYRVEVEPTYDSDGAVGINNGDGVKGVEVACGADGSLPSADFDVEYTPECTITARLNDGNTLRAGDPLYADLAVVHARPQPVTTTVLVQVVDEAGEVVAQRRFRNLSFEHFQRTEFGGRISDGLGAGRYRLEVLMDGMSGWTRRHRSLFVVE